MAAAVLGLIAGAIGPSAALGRAPLSDKATTSSTVAKPSSRKPAKAGGKIPAKASAKAPPKTGAKTAAARRAAAKVKAKDTPPLPEPVRSEAANRVIAWVASSHDNGTLPYIVIDKQAASLSLFDAAGTFLGETPVLLGIGVGDDSTPGVGSKDLAEIGPAERTTPAGRFVAKFGRAFGHQRVLWVDYANSVALHAVITTHKKERRVERLLSPTPDDNRISFGCINVGTSFYTKQIRSRFLKAGGVVYILPDTKPLDSVFPRLRLLPYLAPGAPSAQPSAQD
ncbi:hypothetical protein [Sphingomonas glacialis]|uniref:L,D-transpeptidase n=1 Tax=Sphingomonas glacialis TaxID=658225 RepID=A0A502FY61_9SPHN|nr:hypothetical protein [Sphingomonas glacialis]TPG54351.1 hypothetical protein EAH76_06680 [Sphingomonas glacialis]